MKINKIYNENCLDTMQRMNDNFIDLTVTSPPYDNLRKYKGYSFDFENIAKELHRITKDGGIVVWIVGDATIKGSETGESFKQVLYFKEIGFNLHDTMIYEKHTSSFPARKDGNRYTQIFEYMFVFVKGKIKDITLICDKKNKTGGELSRFGKYSYYNKEGEKVQEKNKGKITPEFSPRTNIWKYKVGFDKVKGHPAIFPEKLANDHIISWSNEEDIVYDCFMGSGTTAKMCVLNNRKYIGSEISKEYVDLSNKRLIKYKTQNKLF